MPQSEASPEISATPQSAPAPVTSWKHFACFLVMGALIIASGVGVQHDSAPGAPATEDLSHHAAIPVYLAAIAMDWALLGYCLWGVRRKGDRWATLSGGRWRSWRSAGIDVAIALPFWALWEGCSWGVYWILGPSSRTTGDSLLPVSPGEIAVWIASSITAGICEEMVFRGYLQRQFHALTRSRAAAILLQGVLFGLFHTYQGWKNVLAIALIGVLAGCVAAWRGNLRANILVHAWADIWDGWLQFALGI